MRKALPITRSRSPRVQLKLLQPYPPTTTYNGNPGHCSVQGGAASHRHLQPPDTEQLHWHGRLSCRCDGAAEKARHTFRHTVNAGSHSYRSRQVFASITRIIVRSDLSAGCTWSGRPVYIEPKHEPELYDRSLSHAERFEPVHRGGDMAMNFMSPAAQ